MSHSPGGSDGVSLQDVINRAEASLQDSFSRAHALANVTYGSEGAGPVGLSPPNSLLASHGGQSQSQYSGHSGGGSGPVSPASRGADGTFNTSGAGRNDVLEEQISAAGSIYQNQQAVSASQNGSSYSDSSSFEARLANPVTEADRALAAMYRPKPVVVAGPPRSMASIASFNRIVDKHGPGVVGNWRDFKEGGLPYNPLFCLRDIVEQYEASRPRMRPQRPLTPPPCRPCMSSPPAFMASPPPGMFASPPFHSSPVRSSPMNYSQAGNDSSSRPDQIFNYPSHQPSGPFDNIRVLCPGCGHAFNLQASFIYNGVSSHLPLEQVIKARAMIVAKDEAPNAFQQDGSGQLGHPECPGEPPYEFQSPRFHSFDRLGSVCPYCYQLLNLKIGFTYLGVNSLDSQEHEIKISFTVSLGGDPNNATFTKGLNNATFTKGPNNATFTKGPNNATFTKGQNNATFTTGAPGQNNATFTTGAPGQNNATFTVEQNNATFAVQK